MRIARSSKRGVSEERRPPTCGVHCLLVGQRQVTFRSVGGGCERHGQAHSRRSTEWALGRPPPAEEYGLEEEEWAHDGGGGLFIHSGDQRIVPTHAAADRKYNLGASRYDVRIRVGMEKQT